MAKVIKSIKKIIQLIINFIKNFLWEFRILYQNVKANVKSSLSKGYGKFKGTQVGGFLHRYLLRYIGRALSSKFFKAMIYLSPALVILLIFTFYPIVNSLLLAFYENYTPTDNSFDGYTLDNFKTVLNRPGFYRAIQNTALLVFISVPLSVFISLFIAVMLNSIKSLRSFFQTVFFLPYVTNVIAIGLVFSLLFDFRYGLINQVIEFIDPIVFFVDLNPVHWKDSSATYASAMTTLLIYTTWSALAFKVLVFTAGIQNIDKQYYDAAKVDGTSKWRTFRRITVPLLSPMIAYVSITSLIGAFKTYTHVVAMYGESGRTAGGIDLRTIVFYVYDYIMGGNALNPGELSRGAAASLMLFGIIFVFTLIQLYVSKKRVHY